MEEKMRRIEEERERRNENIMRDRSLSPIIFMKEKVDLSLNRSLPELESSYWEFIEATEGEDSTEWSSSVQEDISALEGYLMKMDIL
jgi:hypothetical protein